MPTIRVSIRRKRAVVQLEATNMDEISQLLEGVPKLLNRIDEAVESASMGEEQVDIKGIMRFDEKGSPILKVMDSSVTDKEAIMLLLLPVGDKGLKSGDIGVQLSLSGIVAAGYPARLTEMRREGIVMRTSSGEYLLTEKGKTMASELVRRLKTVVQQ
jgi:hypothetical protein